MIAVLSAVLLLSGVADDSGITLSAVGDINLARGVHREIQRSGAQSILKAVIPNQKADMSFGNLECALTLREATVSKRYILIAPPNNFKALSSSFNLLSLANNHTSDAGDLGASGTASILSKGRVTPLINRDGVVIVSKGIKVGWLACQMLDSLDPLIPNLVSKLKRQSDLVVVSIHWGIEYSHQPTKGQREAARMMVNAGASLIIGHGPHVLQPLEWEQGALVAYSMGNFVFDDIRPQPSLSAILHCTLGKTGVKTVSIDPIRINRCRPTLAGQKDRQAIYQLMGLGPDGQPKSPLRLH